MRTPENSAAVSTTDPISDEYVKRGILPDVWTCIAVMSKADATRYLFGLAGSGVPAKLAKDPDGKRWHIAVQGGLPANPLAWIVSIRGEAYNPDTCVSPIEGQHPIEGVPS